MYIVVLGWHFIFNHIKKFNLVKEFSLTFIYNSNQVTLGITA